MIYFQELDIFLHYYGKKYNLIKNLVKGNRFRNQFPLERDERLGNLEIITLKL